MSSVLACTDEGIDGGLILGASGVLIKGGDARAHARMYVSAFGARMRM